MNKMSTGQRLNFPRGMGLSNLFRQKALNKMWVLIFCFLLFSTFDLSARQRNRPLELASINIVDRDGLSETISAPERLKQYAKANFLQNCPYQKVLRVYKRNGEGKVISIITSYYPNGQVKQYLEAKDGRAFGHYREWHDNGQVKLKATIIGGTADIDNGSEISWLFDGPSYAWDEEGHLLAEICYHKGSLEGISKYFHTNGCLWKTVPFHKNFNHGTMVIYLTDGNIFQKTEFANGLQDGESIRYWNPNLIGANEIFQNGNLITGTYVDPSGKKVAEIIDGKGTRAIFSKDYVMEYHEYNNGVPDGKVTIYNRGGKLIRFYHVKNGKKDGEEIFFYETLTSSQPKLSLDWQQDQINGSVKTWYPSGKLESQREWNHNQRNGMSMSWYKDGSLMLIEDYLRDKLVKGEYYKKGEKIPCSNIAKGNGNAQIFDSDGVFLYKIAYANGKPIDE